MQKRAKAQNRYLPSSYENHPFLLCMVKYTKDDFKLEGSGDGLPSHRLENSRDREAYIVMIICSMQGRVEEGGNDGVYQNR